MAPILINCLGL